MTYPLDSDLSIGYQIIVDANDGKDFKQKTNEMK